MADRLSTVLYGLMSLLFLLLAGCPPPAATKPDLSGSQAPQATTRGAGKGGPGGTPRGATPGSSLEALRAGKAPSGGPLQEIYFDFDRYDLRPEARATLKTNAEWLKANASARVQVEGHADERGTNEYNLALGAKRAEAAKDYLITLGIPLGRLSTISYGEELPVCKEPIEQCWQKNRRDRFVVVQARPGS